MTALSVRTHHTCCSLQQRQRGARQCWSNVSLHKYGCMLLFSLKFSYACAVLLLVDTCESCVLHSRSASSRSRFSRASCTQRLFVRLFLRTMLWCRRRSVLLCPS